jgi:hypothetical protein
MVNKFASVEERIYYCVKNLSPEPIQTFHLTSGHSGNANFLEYTGKR